VSLFKANIGQDLRMGFEMRKKVKFEKAKEFATKIKKVHKEVEIALNRS